MLLVRLLFVFLTTFCYCQEKVLIISHHYAQPFFIELQAKTMKKFIKDDYEFVVFNDAKTEELRSEIDRLCDQYGIRCIPISQEIHDRPYLHRIEGEDNNHPCVRCANVVQYSLDVLGFDYPGLVVIIDSDMFPIRPFSFLEFMQGNDLAGVGQSREHIEYLWNGLVMFNMETLPERNSINFNCGRIEQAPVDAGGYTHYYLSKYRSSIHLKWIDVGHFTGIVEAYHDGDLDSCFNHLIPLIEMDPPQNMEILLNGSFLHYRGGGKWDYQPAEYYAKKNDCVKKFIEKIIKE